METEGLRANWFVKVAESLLQLWTGWIYFFRYMTRKYDGSDADEDDTVRYGKVRHESTKSNPLRSYSW